MKPHAENGKIIFLDRDGVINRFPGRDLYVTRYEDFVLLEPSLEAIAKLTRAGYKINVISNQGCLSRGLITQTELDRITEKMLAGVEKAGGKIEGVYYCPHQKADNCDCKKPKTGLFKKALKDFKGDPSGFYFIGDSQEDILAGKNLGCRTILVMTGRVLENEIRSLPAQPDEVKKDLNEAVEWILQSDKW